MPTTLEERVAYLEGKVEEHSYSWQDLRERITHMEQKFDQRFIQIDQRIIEMDNRLTQRMDKLFLFILTTMVSSIGALIGVIVSIFVK